MANGFLSSSPATRKTENDRINTGNLWWAWVDLNYRPRPYQGSVVRFYNNIQYRGDLSLPKILCGQSQMPLPQPDRKASSSSQPSLSLMNEIRRCTRVQATTVRTQTSNPQGKAARNVADSGSLRQPVVHNGGAAHRPCGTATTDPIFGG